MSTIKFVLLIRRKRKSKKERRKKIRNDRKYLAKEKERDKHRGIRHTERERENGHVIHWAASSTHQIENYLSWSMCESEDFFFFPHCEAYILKFFNEVTKEFF